MILVSFLIYNLPINPFQKPAPVQAGTGQNTFGFAWSETIGWISFNSTNCDASIDNGIYGGDKSAAGCSVGANYGVNIDLATGAITGWAWSSNIGWIRLNPPADVDSGLYPYNPQSSAYLDLSVNPQQMKGWARACAGTVNGLCNAATRTDGWDGWIKMRYHVTDTDEYKGVTRDGCFLEGYAWGSDVVGAISFRGIAQDGSPYGVIIGNKPSANGRTYTVDYCTGGANGTFDWTFIGGAGTTQSAYQIQVDNDSDFSSPVVDTCKVINDSSAYVIGVCGDCCLASSPPCPCSLSFNTTYHWRLKVWNECDVASNWLSGADFTTPLHAYPTADFFWKPFTPSAKEEVQFTDLSHAHGDASIASWYWTWTLPTAGSATCVVPTSGCRTVEDPRIKFTANGSWSATLKATDSDGYFCSVPKQVGVMLPLPSWKEIAPPTH